MAKQTPKQEGYNARRWLGKGWAANPYAPESPEHEAWLDGHKQAARDSDQAQAENDARVEEFGEEEDEEDEEETA